MPTISAGMWLRCEISVEAGRPRGCILPKPLMGTGRPGYSLRDIREYSMFIPYSPGCVFLSSSDSLMTFFHNFFPFLVSCLGRLNSAPSSWGLQLFHKSLNCLIESWILLILPVCLNHQFSRYFNNIKLVFHISYIFVWLASYSTRVISVGFQGFNGPDFIERVRGGCWQRTWVLGWPRADWLSGELCQQ